MVRFQVSSVPLTRRCMLNMLGLRRAYGQTCALRAFHDTRPVRTHRSPSSRPEGVFTCKGRAEWSRGSGGAPPWVAEQEHRNALKGPNIRECARCHQNVGLQTAPTGLCCAPSERLPSFCNPTRGDARGCAAALCPYMLGPVGAITQHDDDWRRTYRHNVGLSCAPPRSRLCEEPGPCGPLSIVAESSAGSRSFARTAPWSLAIHTGESRKETLASFTP